MAKKKINKEQLGRELMELMDVSAPMYISTHYFSRLEIGSRTQRG